MPLRPFPGAFSVGTDIISVKRIGNIIQAGTRTQRGQHFLRRFLTPGEQHEFHDRFGSLHAMNPAQLHTSCQHLAGRWAAKEATIKAVTWRRLSFHDVVIQQLHSGTGVQAVILDQLPPNETPRTSMNDTERAPPIENEADDILAASEISILSWKGHSLAEAMLAGKETSEPHDADTFLEQYGELSGQIAKVTISHDGEYATAVCLAAEEPASGDVGGEAAARNLL